MLCAARGATVLLASHNMREVERLCDRIAIMHRGHILAEGTLDDLRQEYEENDLEELFFHLISNHELETIGAASNDS